LKAIGAASKGFVYAISRVGITGTQDKVGLAMRRKLVARLRKFNDSSDRGWFWYLRTRRMSGSRRICGCCNYWQRAGGFD